MVIALEMEIAMCANNALLLLFALREERTDCCAERKN